MVWVGPHKGAIVLGFRPAPSRKAVHTSREIMITTRNASVFSARDVIVTAADGSKLTFNIVMESAPIVL